jgi:hypothetical protein
MIMTKRITEFGAETPNDLDEYTWPSVQQVMEEAQKIVNHNGGPVHPSLLVGGVLVLGKTMRDEFALAVLPALVGQGSPDTGYPSDTFCKYIAERAYKIADAMLAERSKEK